MGSATKTSLILAHYSLILIMFHSFAQVALSPSTARLVGYVVANTLTVFTHFRKKEEESSSMRTIYYQEVTCQEFRVKRNSRCQISSYLAEVELTLRLRSI